MPELNHSDAPLPFPILIGDIGGTNARFSILVDADSEQEHFPVVQTANFATIDDAIKLALENSKVQPRSAILAMAGPVQGDEIPLTNCDWVIRPKTMIANLGIEDVLVINDFEAQALAIAEISDEHRQTIGKASGNMIASRAVLGPGTGLGVGGLVHTQHQWVPVPGEGGHIDLGPRTERDLQIWPHLEPIEGRISAEQVICGRGLQNIYHAICAADSIEPSLKEPADITNHALAGTNKQAEETLTLFVTYLGRVAGDIAMIFMARGGVFLSGGIPQKILPALQKQEFRAAFEDKAPHTELMKTIPTHVVVNPLAALSGLATYARKPTNFGLATEGRRWRR